MMAAGSPDDGLVFVSMNNMLKKIPRKEVSSGRVVGVFYLFIFFKKKRTTLALCALADQNLARPVTFSFHVQIASFKTFLQGNPCERWGHKMVWVRNPSDISAESVS